MLINFLLGLPIMVVCLLLQTALLVVAARYYINHQNLVNNASLWSSMLVISGVMLLVIGNLGQIAVWSWLFLLLEEFQQFDVAFYHSAVNFGSLGYGDIVMSDERKLLGALEAINGVLMIGVSTAALMTTFQNATKKTFVARGGE